MQERKENVEQLLGRAKEWEESHEGISPLLFLEELMLEGAREQGEKVGECVTLATVHNAKGLEFENVFLVGLEEDLFPHINAKKGPAEIEEERRLFYVGMTRAKDRLFMSSAQVRFVFGGARSMRVSRFWAEVPKKYVQPASYSYVSKPSFQEPVAPVATAERFSMGQVVVHPQFGIGRIESIVMTGAGEAYEVFFSNDQKKKKILAAYAPLKVVGGGR
jgi:DNA helicase-2/ATP-dependent DNA helicase PcrA